MKKLRIIAAGVLFTVCMTPALAQEKQLPLNEPDLNKPKLFSDLPQKMNLKVQELDPVFRHGVGDVVKISVADALSIEGTVVSKSEEATVNSIVIRSTNRKGAILTLTRGRYPDGSFQYAGRMTSLKNGDAFEIIREKGVYVLQKKSLHEMIAE